MAIVERDVVLQGKTPEGDTTIDMPITALKNIEDTADVKASPEDGDYIPLIDSKSDGQMKKTPASAFRFSDEVVPVSGGGTGAADAGGARANLGVTPENIGAVKKSGDTMSGSLNITKPGTNETAVTVTNENGSVSLSASGSRGIYDNGNRKWVVQSAPGSTQWHFYGEADNVSGVVAVANGGTGVTDWAEIRHNVGVYYGLAEVGLSGSATLEEIWSKMWATGAGANGRIMLNSADVSNAPTKYGFIELIRFTGWHGVARCYASGDSGKFWLSVRNGANGWSEWKLFEFVSISGV